MTHQPLISEVPNQQPTLTAIVEHMNRVQVQLRTITEAAGVMDSATINTLLPALVNQYQDGNVFGGGIWPLPNRRDPTKEKDSSFFARNASNQLQVNTYWNSDAADKYWSSRGTKDGLAAAKGLCVWAKAYQDAAKSTAAH